MPNTYVNYESVNSLEEFAMIAGTDYTLSFTVYQADGVTLQDIGGATIKWLLSPYGENYNVLEITATVTGDNTFNVVIPGTSTVNLSGKYKHQLAITSFYSENFRPAQGIILISPAIPLN